MLLISWLGHEKPGTRQPLSSLPLDYHRTLVCLFSYFSLFYGSCFYAHVFPPLIPILSFCVLYLSSSFSCVLLFRSRRKKKSLSEPLAELDHRNPAVHSQGPLLLLAVSRANLVGAARGRKSGWREEEEEEERKSSRGHRFPSC